MMHPDARALLDAIDDFLCRCDVAAGEVWDVLTALRSADSMPAHDASGLDVKVHTTLPIRRAAFPRLAMRLGTMPRHLEGWRWAGVSYPTMGPDQCVYVESVAHEAGSRHFAGHVIAAARVLGLPKEEDEG